MRQVRSVSNHLSRLTGRAGARLWSSLSGSPLPLPPLASELLEELTSRAFNDVDAYVLETGRATGLPVVTPNAGIINQILSGPLVRRERFVNIQVVVPPPWP